MRLIVIPNSQNIRVEASGNRFVSFPGEWSSSFLVEENGELIKKESREKFYVDRLTNLFWEGDGIREEVNDVELRRCILAIKAEADRKGWQIVWPDQTSNEEEASELNDTDG